jgi:RimJ/RimL family protein N-acetyltransferase
MDIKTARLTVRPVRASDADVLYDIRQRVARFQGQSDRTLEDTRAMYAEMESRQPGDQPGWHQYVIQSQAGAVMGDVGVNFNGPGPKQIELGYSLHPEWWGRGAAGEALSALLGHLFRAHQLHRAIAITAADNRRSRSLLERLGFRHEGTMIESWWEPEGQWSDEVLYAVLGREWARTAGSPQGLPKGADALSED